MYADVHWAEQLRGGPGPPCCATGYLKACIEAVISGGIGLEHFCQVSISHHTQ